MNIINDLARSGCWDYRATIAPMTIGVPLAVEAGIFIKNVYQKPEEIKEKLLSAKKFIVDAFTASEKKTTKEKIIKISKNIFIAILAISFGGTLSFLSIAFLPSSMAISCAVLSIFYTGKLVVKSKCIIKQLERKEGESRKEARKRITLLVMKMMTIITLTLAAGGILGYIVKPLLTSGFVWHPYIPFQTKMVAFFEYIAVGVVHLALSTRNIIKKKPKDAIFHLFAAALSFIFPFYYLNCGSMRLHHSFYGLLFMTLPYRATQFFGTLVSLDSSLSMIVSKRGYTDLSKRSLSFRLYDFMNIVVKNFAAFFPSYSGSLVGQEINNCISEKKKQIS